MEPNQIKLFKISILLILILLASNLLALYIYFGLTSNATKDDKIAYVSIQQESSPFNNTKDNYIKLHNALSQNFNYYELYYQPLFNTNSLAWYYELYSGKLKKGCEEIISNQIGKKLSDTLEIDEGRTFTESDFIHIKGSKIPVLLGSGYRGIYAIGDTFFLEYLYDNYEFEVIGFLKKDSLISLNMTYYLDNSIIMPFFVVPIDSNLSDGEIIHYANYTSGVVEIPLNEFSEDMMLIKKILGQKICGEYTYAIQQPSFFWKDYLGLYPQTLRSVLVIFLAIISIMLAFCFAKTTFSYKWDLFLFLLSVIINVGLNELWVWYGFSVNIIYYMIIPIIYFGGTVIKRQIKRD